MRKLLIALTDCQPRSRTGRPPRSRSAPRRPTSPPPAQSAARRSSSISPSSCSKGPVVLYFFPKAFTSGCTAEAHAFSESIGDFKKAGAQVIGMSADDLPTLQEFSTKECRSAFPVATADAGDPEGL